ncbi:TauD/TfdA dioxygenase family protein [Pseudohaliea rubra]|uniref:Alpha-ketoglutarate-dependent taurine dioxygenase n=1 Tax=Pseudohaliea rubra DSM 19751 TaxID=1265313 RepID=A0A095VTF3_9GAMM|nr:TauD/TfdA family dioxygenase [Pseudohaliea rubra]KGE04630.1 Alpha-ketoglutarate-dependent taurine dioxygenase [Pseudohaliea rubra DSM 19751]
MNSHTEQLAPAVPAPAPEHVAIVEQAGGRLAALSPIGASLRGIDLRAPRPDAAVIAALESVMAARGFLVFKDQQTLSTDELVNASVWWGGRAMHSTHGVHPATPDGNRHIFRLSNEHSHGIPGVGPQFHNDGAFCDAPFSHVAYHIVRVPEHGGGTVFAHLGAAFAALPPAKQAYWARLTSVNSTTGVAHPLVHDHPLSGRRSVWLHLGMTGAVIETSPAGDRHRLLEAEELRQLCRDYNELLEAGFSNGYTLAYEYEPGDCIFIDNYAVAHRATAEAHRPAAEQGLRIMHRATVAAPFEAFEPHFGLPQHLPIHRPSPLGPGVWQPGGIGFRWDASAPMQN